MATTTGKGQPDPLCASAAKGDGEVGGFCVSKTTVDETVSLFAFSGISKQLLRKVLPI